MAKGVGEKEAKLVKVSICVIIQALSKKYIAPSANNQI